MTRTEARWGTPEPHSALDTAEPDVRHGLGVRCDGLVHIYRANDGSDVVALRGVDLDIAPGERVALVGPSGSGKSTLLAVLGGLVRPSGGRLWLGDTDIGKLSEGELVRFRARGVGTVLQGAARNLLPYATPAQNIEFVRAALPRRSRRALPKPEDLLGELGLGDCARSPLGALSGGEQQRVAIAVAVASAPGVLLADEPTSSVDAQHRPEVLDLFDRVSAAFGTTVVVVTHDPEVGHRLGRTITIRDGRVGSEGRRGEEFGVIAPDGSITIPDRYLSDWPPGTLIRFERDDAGGVRLARPEESPDGRTAEHGTETG